MASLSSVTLELKVSGEQAATQSLNRFYDAGEKVGTSVVGLAGKVSSVQGEWKKLSDLYNRQVIVFGTLSDAQEKLVSQLAKLTGMTTAQARDALKLAEADQKAAQAAQQKAQADAKAAAEAQKRMRSIANLEGSILKESRAISNAVKQMNELTQAQDKGTVSANKMHQAELEVARALAATNGYLKSNGQLNVQRAQAEIRAAQAAERNAKATRDAAAADAAAAANKARLTQSYNQLLASINPVIARQQKTRQTVDMLRAAVAAGAITTTQAAQALNQYRNALRNMDAANQLATRGMNRMGVLTQQAGYQVGDFVVQIQSGTNFMVALGQQATQLIGTFAMLARTTRMIAIFSGLGVAVPILTAIGAGLMRTAGETKTLEDAMGELDEATSRYNRTLDTLEDKELETKFGDLANEIREMSGAMRELNSEAQLDGLVAVLAKIEEAANAPWWKDLMAGLAVISPQAMMSGMTADQYFEALDEKTYAELGINMAREQFLNYSDELKRLAEQGDREGVVSLANKMILDAGDGSEGTRVTAAGRELLFALEDAAVQLAEVEARLNGSAEAARQAKLAAEDQAEAFAASAERMRDIREEQEKAAAKDAETFANMQQTLALEERKLSVLQSYNSEGEKTNRTMMEEAALAGEVVRAKLESQYASEALTEEQQAIVDAIVQTVVEQELANQAIEAGKEEAKGLEAALNAAAAAMGRLEGVGDSIAKALAVAKAEAVALANAANVAVAGKIAGRRFDVQGAYEEAIAGGADPIVAMGERAIAEADLNELETTLKENAKTLEAQREADRAAKRGGTAARKDEEYLYKLEQEAIAKRALIGLSEEQKLQDERRAQITLKLAEDGRALTSLEEERIEQIIKTEAETRKLMEAEQQRQQLMDTVEGHIKNAFMSMVDGSASVEDAFRNMLRNILLAIYEQQVAKPAAEGIGSFLNTLASSFVSGLGGGSAPTTSLRPVARPTLAADGGAWNNGVQFFANGGVVNAPTGFRHSGGLGIMGEAGPEAIMPLKRGKNGKLGVQMEGGSQPVVVNQTFHFQANGDESVKRIIGQSMPQIAQYTSKTIVDQRRKGGSMKAAFRG